MKIKIQKLKGTNFKNGVSRISKRGAAVKQAALKLTRRRLFKYELILLTLVFIFGASVNNAVFAQQFAENNAAKPKERIAEKLPAGKLLMRQAAAEVLGSGASQREILKNLISRRQADLPEQNKLLYRRRLIERFNSTAAVTNLFVPNEAALIGWQSNPNAQIEPAVSISAERLQNSSLPVLKIFGRENYTEVVLFDSKEPFLALYCEFMLLVSVDTTKMLSDSELRAVAAHELAHEFWAEELLAAQRANDLAAMHLIEYKCDLAAAIVLQLNNESAEAIVRAVKRFEQAELEYARRTGGIVNAHNTHPATAERAENLKLFLKAQNLRVD